MLGEVASQEAFPMLPIALAPIGSNAIRGEERQPHRDGVESVAVVQFAFFKALFEKPLHRRDVGRPVGREQRADGLDRQAVSAEHEVDPANERAMSSPFNVSSSARAIWALISSPRALKRKVVRSAGGKLRLAVAAK
jgi:hypothetical protein